ncbi:MAG: Type 1 glutamine amidotransferase-like domain-containing protein [bacterium]|nr:Type 1 glutamine amidotransferase-like domain-containing protein [bacterium]
MIPLFLHGGGEHPQADQTTFGGVIRAAKAHEKGRIALILAAAVESEMELWCTEYVRGFVNAGALPGNMVSLFLSPQKPLTRSMIEAVAPQAIYVCGGVTPLYHQVLTYDLSWLDYLRDGNIPYGGTSAGAAVASGQAILGGWRVERDGVPRQMIYVGGSEDLDLLTVDEGLGLVPFSIEVHASQWGTLTRLIHAVESQAVEQGCAIDENTLLRIEDGTAVVEGLGHLYYVRGSSQGVQITIYKDGDQIGLPLLA